MSSPAYPSLLRTLSSTPRTWLVTGAAGFIGSHLVETLLRHGQKVTALDNFATGHRRNLDAVQEATCPEPGQFTFIEGDICDAQACRRACEKVDYVLHQAALGSVPRSIENPLASHQANVTGFLQILGAARDAKVRRFVYASSSSVYGDSPVLPKVEPGIGDCLSPYAATKRANEVYALAYQRCYGIQTVGLRYFNVFGPRQDPAGAYAAVMPRWFSSLLLGHPVQINGDGSTSRDFCYVANAVQANLLAATVQRPEALGQIYNVACGERTTLSQLFAAIRAETARFREGAQNQQPVHAPERAGDIQHSLADISKARQLLGYEPTHQVAQGLFEAAAWYAANTQA